MSQDTNIDQLYVGDITFGRDNRTGQRSGYGDTYFETNVVDSIFTKKLKIPSGYMLQLVFYNERNVFGNAFPYLSTISKSHRTIANAAKNSVATLSIIRKNQYSRYDNNQVQLSVAEGNITFTAIKLQKALSRESSSYYAWRNPILKCTDGAGVSFELTAEFDIFEKFFDLKFEDDMSVTVRGQKVDDSEFEYRDLFEGYYRSGTFDFTLEKYQQIGNYLFNKKNITNAVNKMLKINKVKLPALNPVGVTKTHDKCKAYLEEIIETEPMMAMMYRTFMSEIKRTINGVKASTIFNELYKDVNSLEDFKKQTQVMLDIMEQHRQNNRYIPSFDTIFEKLPGFQAKRKDNLKNKASGAFNKMMADFDFIDISQEKHPLTYAAITEGKLPLSTFFRSSETYFLFNDNWDIWEEMLEKYPEQAVALAETVRGRTTYEKDLMSYMYFTLHSLPEYLEKHTGKKWTGIPKLVNSADELEPPKEGENGVSKTRSALTPIVDNENCTVTVPYASLRLSGYQTTYCYSLNYQVLTKGLSVNGNVVTKDIEEKLNGRDDYGLMFYTLTGSAQGRGYPSFLIIFERLENDTRVHFHRTHPMRSKDGDYNPIHQWTKGCYKWMIGNIPYENIVAQQGDLAFVKVDRVNEVYVDKVDSYDSHTFEHPVFYVKPAASNKENILGYFYLEQDTKLTHTEHLDIMIPAGQYELRQCRSWEANPKGVWTLRID